MSHILLRLNGTDLAQFPDTELTITRTNPYFNDGTEVESYPFDVPLDGNRQHFQNAEVIESDATIHPVRNGIMEVIVDGVPMISGKCGSIEDQELKDRVSLKLESAVKTLDEYLEGVRCRDVEMKDKIQIGEGLGNVSAVVKTNLYVNVANGFYMSKVRMLEEIKTKYQQEVSVKIDLGMSLPALGFSRPDECKAIDTDIFDEYQASDGMEGVEPTITKSFINVSEPYDSGRGFYYCNGRVCYMHYKEAEDHTSSDEVDTSISVGENSSYNPYLVLEANRPASGICFYVLYFLDCLFWTFRNEGIQYDNSELLSVSDLCKLAFFTTHYKFDAEPKPGLRPLRSKKEINKWLSSRNIQTKLSIDTKNEKTQLEHITIDDVDYVVGEWVDYVRGDIRFRNTHKIEVSHDKLTDDNIIMTAQVMQYFANAQNFPDEDAKTIIDSLWGSFGIKFYLNPDTHIVKPRFIRDILRDTNAPINFNCDVIDAIRETEDIRGFRMKYSGESDDKSKKDNLTNGVTDYDTTYDYCDYSQPVIGFTYRDIVGMAYDSNMNLYVDLTTGNRYRIKIDGDAEKREEYHPVVFEVGQLTGVEIGDCSDDNEDFITDVTSSFQPIIFNDVNSINQRRSFTQQETQEMAWTDNWGHNGTSIIGVSSKHDKSQKLTAFVSEDMWHEYIPRIISYPIGSKFMEVNLNATIKTLEAYDPTNSKTGDSPLQDYDWGLGIVMMNGGGSDSHIDYYDYNYDGFGNAKYRTVAGGEYTQFFDSVDCFGGIYDYNGPEEGIGNCDHFSLKIRSYIPAPYNITGPNGQVIPAGEPLCVADPAIRNRGLFDTFFSEYAHWLLHRKKVKLNIVCEVAALLDIQWHKRYRFGDYVGFINKITSHITAENGLETVEIELFV